MRPGQLAHAFGIVAIFNGILWLMVVSGWAQPAPPIPAGPPAEKPPWQRTLKGEDAKHVKEFEEQFSKAENAGQLPNAEDAAKKILALRAKVQGEGHWEAVDARWRLGAIQKIGALPAEALKEWLKSRKTEHDARVLKQQGRFPEAQPLLEKALAIHSRVLGERHPHTATAHNELAENFYQQAKYAAAELEYEKALKGYQQLLGEDHPHTATCHSNLATNLGALGKFGPALVHAHQALDQFRKVLGDDDPATAIAYNDLANILVGVGRYAEAQPLYEKALPICRKRLGDLHEDTIGIYNNLGTVLYFLGNYRDSRSRYQTALKLRREFNGDDHPFTGQAYNNLAVALRAGGRYAEAEPLFEKALVLRRRFLGDDHPDTLLSYSDLAINLTSQARYAEAEPIYQKALALRRQVLGEVHQQTATAYSDLGLNFYFQRRYTEAQPLLEKALDLARKAYGEDHPDTATGYNNLAGNLQAQAKYAQAAELVQKALDLQSRLAGLDNTGAATLYNNLASLLNAQGKYAEAQPWAEKALKLRRHSLGEDHPDTAESYHVLASNLYAQGSYALAEANWTSAAASFEQARLAVAFSGLGRAALAAERTRLPEFAALLARNGKPAEAWRQLELSLGRGLFDDLAARKERSFTSEDRKHERELASKLHQLDVRAAAASAIKQPEERQKVITDLAGQRLTVKAEISRWEQQMFQKYGVAAGEVLDLSRIQAQVPTDTALLAWLDIPGQPKAVDPNGEHWACVVRREGTPAWVKLDGSGADRHWTKDDDELPVQVAKSYAQRPEELGQDWQKQAALLAKQRLAPVGHILAGNDRLPPVKHLIVLPSPALANVPVEALLTAGDHYTVSYAPSGTMLAWLKNKAALAPAARVGVRSSTSLLALGDPLLPPSETKPTAPPPPDHGIVLTAVLPKSPADKAGLRSGDVLLTYAGAKLTKLDDLSATVQRLDKPNAKDIPVEVWRDGKVLSKTVPPGKLGIQPDPRPPAKAIRSEREFALLMRATRGKTLASLPGTRREVQAIGQTFQSRDKDAPITLLLGSDASEQQLGDLAASGKLAQYRYLHFATHGEADDRRALQSALILAQDRLPDPLEQTLAGKPVYDGRLTAEQIMRTWNLDADLVTLSACESALGKFGGGEGYLGFAQALFLAGARSVVLSLWKVDDDATALLMTRFYQNLLGIRAGLDKPMPKAEALQEAKRWLRNLTVKVIEERVAELPRGTVVTKPAAHLAPAVHPFEHPYYWAAFILVGDPG